MWCDSLITRGFRTERIIGLSAGDFKAAAGGSCRPSAMRRQGRPARRVDSARRGLGESRAVVPLRPVENPAHLRHLQRYAVIARLLDAHFGVPFTRWRFGLDGLLGLVPGAGDIATAIVGAYGLVVAYKLGAPTSIHVRMVINLLVDAGVGTIPIAGDFAFKANIRNHRLLMKWLEQSNRTPGTRVSPRDDLT